VLKEKGFDEECRMCVEDGDDRPLPFDCGRELHKNSLHPYYSAPEQWVVVDWLLINHGIWISVQPNEPFTDNDWCFKIFKNNKLDISLEGYDSPQEAYSAAFDYILTNNLMKVSNIISKNRHSNANYIELSEKYIQQLADERKISFDDMVEIIRKELIFNE
jgi:hypothetical protein